MRPRVWNELRLRGTGPLVLPVDGALLLGASSRRGRCWAGSLWLFKDPRAAANEGFCSAVQAEAEWLTSLGLETGVLVASDPGAVGLWELDKNQTLIVSEFCKYEHADIVSTVKCPELWHAAHSVQVICVMASPHKDSMFLLCGEDNRILLWDTRCPKPALQMGCTASGYLPTSLAWHPQQSEVFVFEFPSWPLSVRTAHSLCWTQGFLRCLEAKPTETL